MQHLLNQIIDKTNPEFAEFPESLNGEIYIKGNAEEGWHTRVNHTPEQIAQMEQEIINAEAKQYLADTDFYIIRLSETGQAIPEEITQLRAEARAKIK